MILCFSLVMMIDIIYYVKSEVCTKCSCAESAFGLTARYSKNFLISSEFTENTVGLQKCYWVIKTTNTSHAITFKMNRIIAAQSSYCGEDFILVRDGNTEKGPPLSFWCKDGTYDVEVTSYSNSIYVEFETYSNGVAGIIFVMSFWESSIRTTSATTDILTLSENISVHTIEQENDTQTVVDTESSAVINSTVEYDISTSHYEEFDYESSSSEATTNCISSPISGSSVQYGPVEYGIANYILIAFSVLIGFLLLGAVVFLIHREYIKNREMKETKFREKLLMRRTGISGRSGGIINDDFRHDSESEKNTSFIFLSPTPTSDMSV